MSRQSRRGPAQILIRGLIPLYLRPTAIVNVLIKEGLSYRRENMFADVNLHLQEHFRHESARDADPFSNMPEEFMIHTPFKNIRQYRAIGWATFENTETGDLTRDRISFYTDGDTDNAILEAQALEQFGKHEYKPNLMLVGFERTGVWKNTDTFDWSKVKELKPL